MIRFYGIKSLKVALSHHLCARIQSCRGDFRSALNSEREAYQIYKLQLGDEHERTRESAQVLKHLTEQAVVLQKRMKDVVKGQLLMIPSITVCYFFDFEFLEKKYYNQFLFRFNNQVFKMF